MNRARLQALAEALVPEVRRAAGELSTDLGGQLLDEYAVTTVCAMVPMIERGGVAAVQPYRLNAVGGALRGAAATLGLSDTAALDTYLRGGTP